MARLVCKLLTKTCTYPLNSPTPQKFCSLSSNDNKKKLRSNSQPSRGSRANLQQVRYVRSYEAMRDHDDDDFNTPYLLSSARVVHKPVEGSEHRQVIYHVMDRTMRAPKYNIFESMGKTPKGSKRRSFAHLQPSNLKPYGSNDNLFFPNVVKYRPSIVYPVVNSKSGYRRFDDGNFKRFSSYKQKDNEDRMKVQRKTHSTSSLKKRSTKKFNKPARAKSHSGINKLQLSGTEQFYKINRSISSGLIPSHRLLTQSTVSLDGLDRTYNTATTCPPGTEVGDYVTVKLGDLQEECRKAKKCKPKKFTFGKLPKMLPPDCPCYEAPPLKEGKPLLRIKKRSEPKTFKVRDCDVPTCTTPRADDNYKVKMKTLRPIKMQQCPCEERVLMDFKIKRLPKIKVPEPARVCPVCDDPLCCPKPSRFDDGVEMRKKTLPKLILNKCPCNEAPPPEPCKPLVRLKPKPVHAKPNECRKIDLCEETPRADSNWVLKKKPFSKIKGDCICHEPEPLRDGPPLRRLVMDKIPEKPRGDCEVIECDESIRADANLKVKSKRLPVFVAQECPCTEEEIPSVGVKLRRLKKKPIPEKPRDSCEKVLCDTPRADEGMVILPKKLRKIEVKQCPCEEIVMKEGVPLKRLVPGPVIDPKNECVFCVGDECCGPRADDGLTPPKKTLPPIPIGNCPCVEPAIPMDVPPLPKLKRRHVTPKKIVCVEERCMEEDRADFNRKVKAKKLPKLQISNCPCPELAEPEDVKPLPRLKKVFIPEPPKICPSIDPCKEIPRADKDDWLYWKQCEVKHLEADTNKTNKRNYSTSTKYGRNVTMSEPKNVMASVQPETMNDAMISSNMKPVDYIAFVVYKENFGSSAASSKEKKIQKFSDVYQLYNTVNRCISTYNQLGNAHTSSANCECPSMDQHLQPKHPITKQPETFMIYPHDKSVEESIMKSRIYQNCRVDGTGEQDECFEDAVDEPGRLCRQEDDCGYEDACKEVVDPCKPSVQKALVPLTVWQKIANYFKARPGCPSPEEFKKMRLRKEAEQAAEKAGLCLYDPKEILKKNEKELPKVITASSCMEDRRK